MHKKLLTLGLAIFGFSVTTFAQTTATASATAAATILEPIAMVKTTGVDMNFGTIGADALAAKTVVLATDGTRTASTATLYTVGTAAAAGSYDITGTANAGFNITLPTTVTVTGGVPAAGADMTITNWVSNLGASSTIGSTGTKTLLVGATLNVGAAQLPGLYTSAPFDVTVQYN
jgi:hypothetical protein